MTVSNQDWTSQTRRAGAISTEADGHADRLAPSCACQASTESGIRFVLEDPGEVGNLEHEAHVIQSSVVETNPQLTSVVTR